jgi:two-component system chemotaxis response regulator CheB
VPVLNLRRYLELAPKEPQPGDYLIIVRLDERLFAIRVDRAFDVAFVEGFAATEQIMMATPVPIVIVTAFPNLTEAEVAARALTCGALTVLHKPPGISAAGYEESARELIATVKAMAEVKVIRRYPRRRVQSPLPARIPKPMRPGLLAIAASIGRPAALSILLPGLEPDFPVPILVVQHIASGFIRTGLLAGVKSLGAGKARG